MDSGERRLAHGSAFIILALLTLALYGDILFSSEERILSRAGTDIWSLFLHLRDFSVGQLRQGLLPLWNPGLFSGLPLLGGMQSALLYPLNWFYLLVPLPLAIDLTIVIHVFLLGWFMYLWAFSRGLHQQACLLAAVLLMFSGPSMMNVYAGQLTDICTMAWAPLLFLAVDKLFARPSLGAALLGMFAVTMQILAGHPQYMYYTALTVLIYSGLCFVHAGYRWSALFSVAGLYAGAAALAAAQLLPGLEAASEGVRQAGVPYDFAAQFSLPPENLLTLAAPFFFGDPAHQPYWGKAYFWAVTFFIGLTGLALALYGGIYGEKGQRRFSAALVLVLTVLALGANTPLFRLLYNFLPGFDKFRGASKFIFPATIFLTMLAGIGWHELIGGRHSSRKAALVAGGAALLAGGLSLGIYRAAQSPVPAAWWRQFMEFAASSGSYLPRELLADPAFIGPAGHFSALTLAVASVLLLLIALLFYLRQYSRSFCYGIAFLAFLEVFVFAGLLRVDFDRTEAVSPELAAFFRKHPGDYRVLNLVQPNSALSLGTQDIWGYDPGVTLRYARFMGFTQGLPASAATNYVTFTRYHKFFRLLRLRYIILRDQRNNLIIREYPDFLPRLQLLQEFKILPLGPAMLREMEKDSFDPRKTAILETMPAIQPVPAAEPGECRIIASTTDRTEIRVDAPRAALLLITDNYSRGWRARGLPDSSQRHYELLPADYTLMAVPLAAGRHHLVIEYRPLSYRVGKWISLLAWIMYGGALLLVVKKRRPGQPDETGVDKKGPL